MTPFVEVPLDPNWADSFRRNITSRGDDFFRRFFGGRLPSASEKHAFIEDSVLRMTPLRIFQNNRYRVEIANTPYDIRLTFIHLAIHRLDGGTCNEWTDLQRIKNEIVGPEYEAMELFPAESRLVNTGNEYHLWVHSDPGFRFPIGWTQRLVFADHLQTCAEPRQTAALLDGVAVQTHIPVGSFIVTPAGRTG
jgi:hypothetical protein